MPMKMWHPSSETEEDLATIYSWAIISNIYLTLRMQWSLLFNIKNEILKSLNGRCWKKISALTLIRYVVVVQCYQADPRESPPFEGYQIINYICIDNWLLFPFISYMLASFYKKYTVISVTKQIGQNCWYKSWRVAMQFDYSSYVLYGFNFFFSLINSCDLI